MKFRIGSSNAMPMDTLKFIAAAVLGGLVFIVGATLVPHNPVNVGAVSSPDVQSPYLTVGGVRTWFGSMNIRTSSTTICSFQSPVSTSTLTFADVQFLTGSSTALQFDIARDTSPSATTTKIGTSWTLSAGSFGTIVASTSPSALDSTLIFPPNTYLNIKYGGNACVDGGTCTTLTGTCNAEWHQN